jgi:hypothetical protein
MNPLAFIAEQKIAQAMKEKDFTDSQWKNRPLPLEEDRFVPEDLKIAYKILKNAGYLPPEIEDRKEVKRLEDLIAVTEDAHERVKQMKKLTVLLMKVEANRSFASNIASQDEYYRKVVERVSVNTKKK